MSTPSIGVLLGRNADSPDRSLRRNPVVQAFLRYSPSQGWATFAILLITLLIVAESVNVAEWVDSDGLTAALLWSAVVGLGLSKLRAPWFVLMPVGLLLGVAVVLWQASRGVEGDSVWARGEETVTRLDVWWEAATGGGISTDLLPFFVMLLVVAWIVGFFGSWFIFRRSNVWVAVVLLGTAVLTNLSFLPASFASRFFLFVLLAMVLVVRMSIVQQQDRWRQLGIHFTSGTGWLTLHAAIWFSIVVVILALVIPLNVYTNRTVVDAWNRGRAPVAAAEDFFSRLFAALPSKKDQPGRFFGKWLPFIGEISFGGEPVAWATSDYPSYWLSQTYNYYTSKGWIATETEELEIGPDVLPPPRSDNLKRTSKTQVMQLTFSSNKFLSGGSFDWVSRPGVVEALEPRKFHISMENSEADVNMPPDIQELAKEIRSNASGMTAVGAETTIAGILPDDLLIEEVETGSNDSAETIILQRKGPSTPDLVSWHFSEYIPENEPYRMVSYVSLATDDDLRSAPTDYGNFITDHYLQLPASLPERVRILAESLTASAANPLDKALRIENYLRGPDFTYSQEIEAPPADADGVDWFLFENRAGYSDYFGSSMTIMLRSVGVPARMAAGYAPGELNLDGQRVIRDSDSHGWVQAYFPGYGWIDFEPTPNWPTHEREALQRPAFGGGVDLSNEDPDALSDPLEMDPFIEGGFDGSVGSAADSILSFDYSRFVVPMLVFVGIVAGLWLIWTTAWNFGLGSLGPQARLYAKLTRLGWLAGIGRRPEQTPIEFGRSVGQVIPAAGAGALQIATSFAALRYGPVESNEAEVTDLLDTWKNIRLSLVGQVFRRFVPQARERAE